MTMPKNQAERYALDQRVLATPLGALFLVWEEKLTTAWSADCRLGSSETVTTKHLKAVRELWRAADAARVEFLEAILKWSL